MFPGAGVLQRNDPHTGLVEVEVHDLDLEAVIGMIKINTVKRWPVYGGDNLLYIR